ncbi:hypothetical protein [Brotaphodocola sp.]|uniref:hypothetical protein n=1 Tax=Brotaphodocola sp. TaxID=3073577 RepID=UPI003D7D65B4
MSLYNDKTWSTVKYVTYRGKSGWKDTYQEREVPGLGNADEIMGKSANDLRSKFMSKLFLNENSITDDDIKALLAMDLGVLINDKLPAGKKHNECYNQLYGLMTGEKYRESCANLLVDFQISQMESLGKKIEANVEGKEEKSPEWRKAVDVSRYPETMYIMQAEILLKDLYPEIDRNKKFEERVEQQKWDYEDRRNLLIGLRYLEGTGSSLNRNNSEELRKMFRQFQGRITSEKPGVFYRAENFPFWDGEKRTPPDRQCAIKYEGRVLSWVWYDENGEMQEQKIKDFTGEKGTAFQKEFLENKDHSFDGLFKQILKKYGEILGEKKEFYNHYAEKLDSELTRFDDIFEQKEKLDKMLKTQLRLDHKLADAKEEHDLKCDLTQLLSDKNKYSGEMISYLEQKRAGFLAEAGGAKPENLESGKAENFQWAALLKVRALDEMLKTAEIFNKDLTETAKSKAVEEQNKRTPGMVNAGEELLKKENKESVDQKIEDLRSALDERAEWAKDGSTPRKKLLYEENLKRIADVTKRLSSTYKKENDPDSKYFTNMMTRLNEFGKKKENDRDKMIEACEAYIKKRKGLFFGPQTAVGKERLNLAREAIGILKELETEKILTKEEVKNWDEQRAETEALREEYRQVRERAQEREKWKKHQNEQDEIFLGKSFDGYISKEYVDANMERSREPQSVKDYYDKHYEYADVEKKYDSGLKYLPKNKVDWLPKDSFTNLCVTVGLENERLKDKKELSEPERVVEYFSDAFKYRMVDDRKTYEKMNSWMSKTENSQIEGVRAEARDKLMEYFSEVGDDIKKGVQQLMEIEDKKGWSPETENALKFFMSLVNDGELGYSRYRRSCDREYSPFYDTCDLWNHRENGKILREAYHVMNQAVEEGFGTEDGRTLSMQDQERKAYYEKLTKTIKKLSDQMYQYKADQEYDKDKGPEAKEREWENKTRKELVQLRREFDDVVHYTSETDEKQLAALHLVSSAMKQVEEVYPRFKSILEPEEIKNSVLKDAYYFKDAEKKLMGLQTKQKLSFDDFANEKDGSAKQKTSSKTKIPRETEKNKMVEKTEAKSKSRSAK